MVNYLPVSRLRGRFEMRLNKYLALGLLLALASTSAMGFQEQTQPVAPSASPESSAPAVPEADLAPGAATKPQSSGTEVRIPGLGKLGVLPKMDFGLELLYGASEAKPAEEDRDVPADDLTIRGTIKHPF